MLFLYTSGIVVIGGLSFGDTCRRVVQLYDTTTGRWSWLPELNVGREACPGAVVVQRIHGHRIYVFGGRGDKGVLGSCEVLDVDDGQWSLIESTMDSPRSNTCAVLLDHDTVVICGGFTRDGGFGKTASCERFDLTCHTFSSFPGMMHARSRHAAVHYNGTVVVMGGHEEGRSQITCEQFDPDLLKWIPFPSLTKIRDTVNSRAAIGAAVVGGMIYAAGYDIHIEIYDGSAWNVMAPSFMCRFFASVVACDGKVVVLGGFLHKIDAYDPSTHSISIFSGENPGASRHMVVVSY